MQTSDWILHNSAGGSPVCLLNRNLVSGCLQRFSLLFLCHSNLSSKRFFCSSRFFPRKRSKLRSLPAAQNDFNFSYNPEEVQYSIWEGNHTLLSHVCLRINIYISHHKRVSSFSLLYLQMQILLLFILSQFLQFYLDFGSFLIFKDDFFNHLSYLYLVFILHFKNILFEEVFCLYLSTHSF